MLQLEHYKLADSYVRSTMEKGGVIMFVSNNIVYKPIDVKKYCVDQHFEACCIELYVNTLPIYVVAVYRAPSGKINVFLQQVESLLTSLRYVVQGATDGCGCDESPRDVRGCRLAHAQFEFGMRFATDAAAAATLQQ